MPINDTYTVLEPVIRYLCDGERSFLAMRLVHGLLYALSDALRGQMALVPAHFGGEHNARTSKLAAAVGPESAKDNRWIHQACEELSGQGIFASIRVDGRRVRFKLGQKFSAAFSNKSKAFAILHTDHVRLCRTVHDLMFLSLACLHRNKDRPKFFLPRIPLHLPTPLHRFSVLPQAAPEQATWRVPWSRSSRCWVNAAVRVSGILDHGYLIGPQQGLIDDFVSEVAVKIQHGKTKWDRNRLYKFPARTRGVIEIPVGGTKAVLNAEAFRNKSHQTVIR